MGGLGYAHSYRPMVGYVEAATARPQAHGRRRHSTYTRAQDASPSPELAIIAKELALRRVELSVPPDAQHTPGVGHIFADKLSRVFPPKSSVH